jgi:hypothetical protein
MQTRAKRATALPNMSPRITRPRWRQRLMRAFKHSGFTGHQRYHRPCYDDIALTVPIWPSRPVLQAIFSRYMRLTSSKCFKLSFLSSRPRLLHWLDETDYDARHLPDIWAQPIPTLPSSHMFRQGTRRDHTHGSLPFAGNNYSSLTAWEKSHYKTLSEARNG